jgi:ornithine carbamoyltransferase
MVKLELELTDIDYDTLLRDYLPRIKDRLEQSGSPLAGMVSGGMASTLLQMAPASMKDRLAAEVLNMNAAKLEQQLSEIAARNGVSIRVFNDPKEGVRGANVLYTDVWVSMGEEAKTAERIAMLRPYQINMDLMAATGNLEGKLMFLHCLPAFHDFNTEVTKECGALEVTDEVFESKYSKVFDESENRMHTIKALLVSALCDRAAL